jgi:hypothetical protein
MSRYWWPLATLLALTVTASARAATICPSAAAVEQRLQGELPTGARVDVDAANSAPSTDAADDTFTVRLVDADGQPVVLRTLPARGSCDERAAAAALVIRIWACALHGRGFDVVLEPPAAETPTSAAPAVRRVMASPSRLRVDVAGAALAVYAANGGWSFGGAADVTLGPRRSAWSARLGVAGASPQQRSFGPGVIWWTRPRFSIGATVERAFGPIIVRPSAAVLVGMLVLGSSGFSSAQTAVDADVALAGGVRVAWATRAGVAPFVEPTIVGWLRPETAQIAGLERGTELGRLEVMLSVGLQLGSRRSP